VVAGLKVEQPGVKEVMGEVWVAMVVEVVMVFATAQ
jgi:hypothetical protein